MAASTVVSPKAEPVQPVEQQSNSRPASPGIEATEEVLLEETAKSKDAIKLENQRRKSMSWKGKLTRQLSSAQLKLKNPFKDKKGPVMQSEPGTPIEHRESNFPQVDCLEVPDQMRGAHSEGTTAAPSEGSASSSTLSPNIDAEYLTKLEQEIVTSLDKLGYREDAGIDDQVDSGPDDSIDTSESSDSYAQPQLRQGGGNSAMRPRTTSQPTTKRVEFSDNVSQRSSVSGVEGAYASRPSNLDLNTEGTTDGAPVRPPRSKKSKDKRSNDRLFSVPNSKSKQLKDLRSKSGRGDQGAGSSFTANLKRRFSKYQLQLD